VIPDAGLTIIYHGLERWPYRMECSGLPQKNKLELRSYNSERILVKTVLFAPPMIDRIRGRLKPIAMDAVKECPPYGIYLLASILKAHGHYVVIADLIADGTHLMRKYLSELKDCNLVGIGATSLSWPTALEVIWQVRRARKDVPIVLGGIHPTMFDRYILRVFPVQYVIRGEGEEALPALCTALESNGNVSGVPNLSWRSADGKIIRNPIRPKIAGDRLASYPLPDFGMLPSGIYQGLSVESSRGCVFDCAFCSTSYRRSWRALPTELFVDRLEAIMQYKDRTRSGVINIIDDEFSTNPGRVVQIVRVIRSRHLKPSLTFDARAPDLLKHSLAEEIAEFTREFLVGAECGYDEGLERVGKKTTCKSLEDAARELQRLGISARASFSFIIGLPWETRAEVDRTIRFAMHLLGSYGVRILLQWYLQIPGSRIWDKARRRHVISEAMYDDYGFFRNLYLFRSGVSLPPKQVWEIADMVGQLKWITDLKYPDGRMLEFGFPPPIQKDFPREIVDDEDAGLESLRQVSCAGINATDLVS